MLTHIGSNTSLKDFKSMTDTILNVGEHIEIIFIFRILCFGFLKFKLCESR